MSNASWENRFDNNRRMSLLNLSNHSEEYLRPRSNSAGNIRTTLRTPTPYPFNPQCFVYPSPSYASKNEFDSPTMVVTGKSPSILDCTNMVKRKTSAQCRFKLILGIILTLLGMLIVGIVLSKVGSKSKVSCVGKHFCYPTIESVPKFLNLKVIDSNDSSSKQIQDAVQKAIRKRENEINKNRILKPRIIPKIVGTIDVKIPENVKNEVTESRFDDNLEESSASHTLSFATKTKMPKQPSGHPGDPQIFDYSYEFENAGDNWQTEKNARDTWQSNFKDARDTWQPNFKDARDTRQPNSKDARNTWQTNSINREMPTKKERPRFMTQESHYDRQYMPSYSERERYLQMERMGGSNTKNNKHPPGVNPRLYERGNEL